VISERRYAMKREAAPSSKNNDRGLFRLRAEESHSMTIRTMRITRSRLVLHRAKARATKRDILRGEGAHARAYIREVPGTVALPLSLLRAMHERPVPSRIRHEPRTSRDALRIFFSFSLNYFRDFCHFVL